MRLFLRWGAIFLAALLVLVLFREAIGSTASRVVAPLHGIKTWLAESSGTAPSYFRDRGTLVAEIERLKEARAGETGNRMTIERLREENERLKDLREGGAERIVAGVIGRPPMMPYDVIMVDRGSTDGVMRDAVVYAHGERAVGLVSAVYPASAVVTLFSAPGVESSVYVYGPDIYTHARGAGGGVIEISVPQGIGIERGNVVVIPTLESGVVGAVREVESNPTEPEQRAYVVMDVPLQSLRFVSISARVPEPVDFETARGIVQETRTELLQVDVPREILIEVATSSTSTPPGTGAANGVAPTEDPGTP